MKNANCCDRLRDAIQSEIYPLAYDDICEEVQLATKDGFAVVKYCPFCGQKLVSGRGDLFIKPTEADIADFMSQTNGLKSLDEVIDKLGLPDLEGTGGGPMNNPWVKWIRYTDKWETLTPTIGEFPDGGIGRALGGQPKDKS